jgi:hypothetical protein
MRVEFHGGPHDGAAIRAADPPATYLVPQPNLVEHTLAVDVSALRPPVAVYELATWRHRDGRREPRYRYRGIANR